MKTRNAIKIQNLAKGSTVSSADESNCLFAELTEEEMTMTVGGLTLTAEEKNFLLSQRTKVIINGFEAEEDRFGNIYVDGELYSPGL